MVGLDLWVKVENGQVVSRPNKLPADVQTWGADKDALIRSGWYPIESVKPETFADATEVWESESFDIESDKVIWTLIKRNKTAEELQAEADQKAELWRLERNGRLAESDWTQVADAPVDKAAWATYRQALRDLPSQEGFPNEVTWPTEPVEEPAPE
jgi:hypothetical protein